MSLNSSAAVLMKEHKELKDEKWLIIDLDDDNINRWNVVLMVVNPDSYYAGGYYKCTIQFPKTYPYAPPDFRFNAPLWHPNIYPDGRICISILHAPGDDIMSGESAGERWSPAQRVESVLISILSLLDDPEINSPANVDASVMFRDDKTAFRKRVQEDVEKSRRDMPKNFEMPTHESIKPAAPKVANDDDFWADSDAENDFDFDDGADMGSDTSEQFNGDSEEEEDDEDEHDEEPTPRVRKTVDNSDRLDSDMTEPDED